MQCMYLYACIHYRNRPQAKAKTCSSLLASYGIHRLASEIIWKKESVIHDVLEGKLAGFLRHLRAEQVGITVQRLFVT